MAEQEAQLLARYAHGQDAEAFRALVEAHQNMVFAVCHRVLHNRADAEDAAQDCFFRLAQKAGELTAPIAGWLHTVAVQRAIDLLRRRTTRRAYEAKVQPPAVPDGPVWEHIRGQVDEAIAALPERLRLPVVLYYLEGRTQEQVAAELGISQPAVSGRLKRAVAALRKRLEETGADLSGGVLVPLLSTNTIQAAPATLSAALGKMALAGVGRGAVTGLGAARAVALAAASAGALLAIVWLAVWALLAVVSNGSAEAPAEAYSALAPSPGARRTVLELVVGGALDGTGMFVDLDNGQLHSMPERVAELPAMLDWMRRTGVDALHTKAMEERSLIGADLAAVRVPNRVWQEAAAGGYVAALPQSDALAFPVRLEAPRDAVATYCVRTREGTVALLQLTGVERGAEGGMNVRWMMIAPGPSAAAGR